MQPVSIKGALGVYSALARLGFNCTRYGLGAKASENPFFRNFRALLGSIKRIDCSGFVRLVIYRATKGKVLLPDGSQNMRAHFEELARDPQSGVRSVDYSEAAHYITPKRLFICFIKPNARGCGDVGHVWLLVGRKGKAMTLESHGGRGVDSRPWNTHVLLDEDFSCYELPATA